MPTQTIQVAASADDAYQFDGGTADITSPSASLGTGTVGATPLRAYGVRFALAVPQGATISAAILQVSARGASFNQTDFTWYGQAADDAAAFSGGEDLNTRPKTTANVVCSENISRTDGVFYVFPSGASFAAIIQEIVNRAGWASGNHIVLLGIGTGASSFASTAINSYDNSPALAAKLIVTTPSPAAVDRMDTSRYPRRLWRADRS